MLPESPFHKTESTSQPDALPLTLAFSLFFLSGALSLVYEVSWARALALQFGSTSLAVSTVLAVFMAGLALGAWLSGRMADRSLAPLTTYAVIEILLACYALLTTLLFQWTLPVFEWFGSNISNSLWAISLVRFVVSAILLLPPTMLMGATLPILSRFYVLRKGDGGRGAGLLYGVNTLGAYVGTLSVGLLLLPKLGLRDTIAGTAWLNLLLGGIAFLVGRRTERPQAASTTTPPKPPSSADESSIGPVPSIFTALALTGFAAMVCEVTWTRILVLVLGASIYAFTVMLSTFLAGLGLGAAGVAAFLRADPSKARFVFFFLALLSAVTLWLSSATFQHLPDLFRQLYWSWNLEAHPERVLHLQFLIAAAVMAIPALVMGGLFPAAVRIIVRDPRQTSRGVGSLYAWNTVGAIGGSVAAGFLLIPLLGIRATLLLAVAAQCVAAVVVVNAGERRAVAASAAAVGVCLVVFWVTPPWHHQLMSSAMYKYASSYAEIEEEGLRGTLEEREELIYYRDGLTATVTVLRAPESPNQDLFICTNGKIDGSSHYDMPTQRLAAHAPLLFHHDPREVCVIGMGTGCTAASAALHESVDRVTVVEIESAMVEGARYFWKHNHLVHENPKVDIQVTDGRLFLRMNSKRFDVVISEPSNPWLAGCADLFTTEFFGFGARALQSHGLFCQWVQLYGLSPDSLRTIVRSFSAVFPYVHVISTIEDTDILLLGSRHPFALNIDRARLRMGQEEIHQDLADPRVNIDTIQQLASRFILGPEEVNAYIGSGPLHTDDLPVIAYLAPKDLYRDTRRENMLLLAHYAKGTTRNVQCSDPRSE